MTPFRKFLSAFIFLVFSGTYFSSSVANAQVLPVTHNLRIWLDATDVNDGGAQPANGATVSVWHDKSGLNHDVTDVVGSTFQINGLNNRPAIFMPNNTEFSTGNIFQGSNSPETTIFIVQAQFVLQGSAVLNLNGGHLDNSGTNARYSVHLPWPDGKFYFDAGGCCTTERVSGTYPVPATQPTAATLANSINGFPGITNVKQLVRINSQQYGADNDAVSPAVHGGFRLGSTSGRAYEGHISEVLVYDAALSLTEMQDIECYLTAKWAIVSANSCYAPAQFSLQHSSEAYSENTHSDFNVPSEDLIYTLQVSHVSGMSFDANSMFMVSAVPSDATFYNGDYNGPIESGTDPVGFVNSGSALNFTYATDIGYSSGASPPTSPSNCTYTPAAGYDPNVRFICISPGGALTSGSAQFKFRARVK